jgi:hypothetical protein
MRARSAITLGTLAAVLLGARPAAADSDYGRLVSFGVLVLVAPAHVGADVSPDASAPMRGVVGWSYQIPIKTPYDDDVLKSRHGLVFGGDVLFHGGVDGRGRVGYRYTTYRLFGGAGVSVSAAGATLSPEVGVKFGHFSDGKRPSLHVLVRGEVTPNSTKAPTATIAVGWNLL